MADCSFQPLTLKAHGYPGALITFCGVDGSGKSSLIGRLEQRCSEAGLSYVRTATPTRRIRDDAVFRQMVDDPCNTSTNGCSSYQSAKRVNVLSVLLSIMGDLIQHTTDTIIPALERGDVVLCDRYVFTSQAEIGARTELAETAPVLACIAQHILRPDLAFGLNVSGETSSRRVRARNDEYDQPPPMSFLRRQVNAYRVVAEVNGLVTLNTERGLDETLSQALSHFAGIERALQARRRDVAPSRLDVRRLLLDGEGGQHAVALLEQSR